MRGIIDLAEEVLASRNGFCTVESAEYFTLRLRQLDQNGVILMSFS